MTKETLEKANKVFNRLQFERDTLDELSSRRFNKVKFTRCDKMSYLEFDLENDTELLDSIINHYEKKVLSLEIEFESI